MTTITELSEFDEISNVLPLQPILPVDDKQISPLDAKVHSIAPSKIETDFSSSKSLVGRVIQNPTTAATFAESIDNLEVVKATLESSNEKLTTKSFDRILPKATLPNIAYEMMMLGIAKEEEIHGKINKHLEEGQKLREQIHSLLDLSASLTRMPSDAKELSDEAKSLLTKLKEDGINLWDKLDGPISKEKIIELKSEASGQVDRLRSDVNILLSTKVNYLTQVLLPALLEMMKKAASEDKEAKSRINERMRS